MLVPGYCIAAPPPPSNCRWGKEGADNHATAASKKVQSKGTLRSRVRQVGHCEVVTESQVTPAVMRGPHVVLSACTNQGATSGRSAVHTSLTSIYRLLLRLHLSFLPLEATVHVDSAGSPPWRCTVQFVRNGVKVS